MRAGLAALSLLLAAGVRLEAQASPGRPAIALPRVATQAETDAAPQVTPGTLRGRVQRLAQDPLGLRVAPESLSIGDRQIDGGETVPGTVGVARGNLTIDGTVAGDAVALDGDVIVRTGGRVLGDAVSVGGRVRLDGGRVDGEMRTLSEIVDPGAVAAATAPSRIATTRRALGIAIGWLTLLVALGIGVVTSAGRYLDDVTESLERRLFRAFGVGLIGQIAIIPVLIVGIILLVMTVLGILLVPFAIVAYMLAIAGVATLGFLAVARVTGSALVRGDGDAGTPRSRALRALILGIVCYLGLWVLAAAFTWSPWIGAALRGVAAIVTWVAVTAGFGAAILSRFGRRAAAVAPRAAPAIDDFAWQTPTPISGVVAARRPTPAHTPRTKEPL